MDRDTFLSCVPFLIPTRFNAWPHDLVDRSLDILLHNEVWNLSIEPNLNQPAYFIQKESSLSSSSSKWTATRTHVTSDGPPPTDASAAGWDPAVASFEIAVEYGPSAPIPERRQQHNPVRSSHWGDPNDGNSNNQRLGSVTTLTTPSAANTMPATRHSNFGTASGTLVVSTPLQDPYEISAATATSAAPATTTARIYFKIDGKVYLLDPTTLIGTELVAASHNKTTSSQVGNDDNEAAEPIGSRRRTLPANLVVHFSTCLFRIYSCYHDFADQHVLQTIERRILQFQDHRQQLQQLRLAVPPLLPNNWAVTSTTPANLKSKAEPGSGSSGSSTVVAGHGQPANAPHIDELPSIALGREHDDDDDRDSKRRRLNCSLDQDDSQNNDALDHDPSVPSPHAGSQLDFLIRLEERHQAESTCRRCLDAVEELIDMPASSIAAASTAVEATTTMPSRTTTNNNNNSNLPFVLGSLLNMTAEMQSRSFCTTQDQSAAVLHYESQIQQHYLQMEHVLAAMFPLKHQQQQQHGRQRRNTYHSTMCRTQQQPSPQQQQQVSDNCDSIDAQGMINSIQSLLEQQKQLLVQRHALLLLPTRNRPTADSSTGC